MAKLNILEFPDPRLRTVAKPVSQVDGKQVQLLDDLLETMYSSEGIGLAASQVDVHQRMLVVDVSEDHKQPRVFVNPEIMEAEGTIEVNEGCLSIPGFYEPVRRHRNIHVGAIGRDGEPFDMEAEGMLAVCIQHEMDHLEGKLFIDYLSQVKRQLIRKRLFKAQKQRAV